MEFIARVIAVMLGLVLFATLLEVWLLHSRIPLKKKAAARKKKKSAVVEEGFLPVKRHRAISAEEIQPRE